MTESKKIKVEFAPGCFDDFYGTQEELNELVDHIRVMAENGELDAMSQDLDDETWDDLTEDEQLKIAQALSGLDDRRLN
jgi:hypothetical protein